MKITLRRRSLIVLMGAIVFLLSAPMEALAVNPSGQDTGSNYVVTISCKIGDDTWQSPAASTVYAVIPTLPDTLTVTFKATSTCGGEYKNVYWDPDISGTIVDYVGTPDTDGSDGEVSFTGTLKQNSNGTYTISASSPSAGDPDKQTASITLKILKLDFDIYQGQGGAVVPEASEESVGAFTVANLNDSNYNGTADKDENPVTDEKDLMRLDLNKPAPDPAAGTVRIIFTSGSGNVWTTSTKTTQVTNFEVAVTDLPKTWYIEATAPTALQGIKIQYEFKAPSRAVWMEGDKVSATGIWTDLDAMKVSHNAANGELPDNQSIIPGAFVPVNDDDDDYDDTADKDQSGVTGETDLLPIKLHQIDPSTAGGTYTLEFPAIVRIWQNDDATGAVTSATEFDATEDTDLFVEGISAGSGYIKINWTDATHTLEDCDAIKITVFSWVGPLSVPGYSIHRYTATGAADGAWTTPSNGGINSGAGSNDITVLWTSGPANGAAVYQATSDYVWDLEVNVVQVDLDCRASTMAYGNYPTQSGGAYTLPIDSTPSPDDPAMTAEITISTMEGPLRSGVSHRGVKFISVGFIQNGTVTRKHGLFNGLTPPKKRVSSLESAGVHLDCTSGSTPPWYDSATGDSLFAPSTDATYTNEGLLTDDWPNTLLASDTFTLSGDDVDAFRILVDFTLYVAVRTSDTRNNASSKYTQRAWATWHVNGDGSIASGVYTRVSANGGFSRLSEITSGTVVPITGGTLMNDLSETWSTVNQ